MANLCVLIDVEFELMPLGLIMPRINYHMTYDKLNDQVSYQLITYHYDVMI